MQRKNSKIKFIITVSAMLMGIFGGCSDQGSAPEPNTAPVITSPPAIAALVDRQFSYEVEATDAEGDIISIQFANLPSWLTAGSHTVTGMAMAGTADTSFTAVATDGSLADTIAISLRVVPTGEIVSYADSIQPIFTNNCIRCHGGIEGTGGLRLESHMQLMEGGASGPAVIEFLPDESHLIYRIEGTVQPRMPFDGPPYLTDEQIQMIREWILQGALDD